MNYIETDSREEKILKNKALVISIVEKKYWYLPKHYDREDMISDGMVGLIRAIDKFDSTKTKFSYYAQIWINSFIQKGLKKRKNLITVPSNIFKKINQGVTDEDTKKAKNAILPMSPVDQVYCTDALRLEEIEERDVWLKRFKNVDFVRINGKRIRATDRVIERLKAI